MAARAAVEDGLAVGVGVDRRVERWGCERRTEERFERWACRVERRARRAAMSVSRSSVEAIVVSRIGARGRFDV